jgi:hypothetical protein
MIEGILKDLVSLFVEFLLAQIIVIHQRTAGIFWIMDVEWGQIFRVPVS